MTLRRFYVHPDALNLEQPELSGEEVLHFRQVLRGKVGDRIVVFDGEGRECLSEVCQVQKHCIQLRILEEKHTPPNPLKISLLQAIPKGKVFEDIIQKSTELGVSRIRPVISQRTIVNVDRDDSESKFSRWKNIAIEAAKQSGNNWVPQIDPPVPFSTALLNVGENDLALIASLAPDAAKLHTILKGLSTRPGSVLIAIGPEGDFSEPEIQLAHDHGLRSWTLGKLVLRCETAAVCALSVLNHELGE